MPRLSANCLWLLPLSLGAAVSVGAFAPPGTPVTVVNPTVGDCFSGAGCLEPTFGASGTTTYQVPGAPQFTWDAAVQADIGFARSGVITIDRITSNGQGNAEQVRAGAIQPDGRILVAGWNSGLGTTTTSVLRLRSFGADTTFETGGEVLLTSHAWVPKMTLQPDGKIVVVTQDAVFRLTASGALDSSFGAGGRTLVYMNPVTDVALQSDRKSVVAGVVIRAAVALVLIRLTATGQFDSKFGTNRSTKINTLDFNGKQDHLSEIAIASDNSTSFRRSGDLGDSTQASSGIKDDGAVVLGSAEPEQEGSAAATQEAESLGSRWPRVKVSDPITANLVRNVLNEVSRLFLDVECRALLTEFHDGQGRPLVNRLTQLGVDIQTYLPLVTFSDYSADRVCGREALAMTMPGSRVVHVCGLHLAQSWRQNPQHVVAVFVHEILHTLGLGENPPVSAYITGRVMARCRSRTDHASESRRARRSQSFANLQSLATVSTDTPSASAVSSTLSPPKNQLDDSRFALVPRRQFGERSIESQHVGGDGRRSWVICASSKVTRTRLR